MKIYLPDSLLNKQINSFFSINKNYFKKITKNKRKNNNLKCIGDVDSFTY